ncbi:MAG: T9SS type A sorting domain-containing protein [Bacteroidetes bacterium]|nr:T9SS type A sorting domain-containing protein [Bacteroidota bacterium]
MKTLSLLLITAIFTSFLFTPMVYSKPDVRISGNVNPGFISVHPPQFSDVVIIQQVLFDPNNISTYIYNKGIFNQDLSLSNTPGFQWPINSGKFACFTAGLCISAKITGELRQAMASYSGEYAQGYVNGIGGPALRDSTFRVYKIKRGDNQYNNPDYAQWGNMVPFGAPYIDVNNNHQYEPGIDTPGIKNAKQVIFVCLTDGFPEEHNLGEGFGGGTLPMMAQVQLTAWGYDKPGLIDIQFLKYIVINKNINAWDSTFMGVVVDSDLGWADDDYIGCDLTRNLGYCYNGDNDDNTSQSNYAYGINPPAFGMDLLKGAVNNSITPPDTLGLSSFVYFTNTGSGGPPCENDPNGEPVQAYNMLQGLKKDRTPWYNRVTGLRTKFTYSGDPETFTGWTERMGSITNCNGDSITYNNIIYMNPPGDRRFILGSGAGNFVMSPGDTQNIIVAQLIARGTSNLNSVTKLKQLSNVAQNLCDSGFVIGVNQISSTVPEGFKLHQNYPNPFNPVTKIKFDIPRSSHTRMIIFDILGREVATLVNEKLSAGSYETEWDGSGFPSGVYFCRLVTEEFSETKRMVLLK